MWSKTRQILESRLAEGLKGHVSYHYDVYHTNKDKVKKWWWTEMHVFSIIVDGKPWFCSNPKYFRLMYQQGKTEPEIIREYGFVPTSYAGGFLNAYIHEYLNELSIEDAINNDNYFIRLLAVLDVRLGKRKVKALVNNIENEPEWFRKWILLMNGENSNQE